MANLNFKYGSSWASLKSQAISNGTIYVTKDEKAMYVDLDGARYRLGQIIDFQTWEDFNQKTTTPPQNPDAYYYIIDQNALLRYDSVNSKWNQINTTSDVEADISKLEDAVNALTTKVNTNITDIANLKTADTTLQNNINAEATARAAKDTELEEAIAAEQARAEAAEAANARDVSTLNTKVTNIEKNYATTATLDSKVSNLQEQITSNDTDISALQNAIDDESTGLKKQIKDVKATADSNSSAIAGLTATVGAIPSTYVKLTDYNAKMTSLDNSVADHEKRVTALEDADVAIKSDITKLTDRVSANETAISNLQTTTTTQDQNISALQTADTEIKKSISDEIARAKAAEADNAAAITAEKTRATQAEAALENSVSGLKATTDSHTTTLATHTSEISSLTKLVGTLPADTAADNVVDFVIEQMEAADAMTFKGEVASSSQLPDGKTEKVNAGDTYVVTEGFTLGNESYYAGDLIVASQDQGDATSYSGGWTHVKTGYVMSQENKLVQNGNGVKLTTYTGTALGSLAIASDNISISTASSSNNTTITMNMEWGTF